MSAFTKKLRAQWGAKLEEACAGSLVPVSFLAGLISRENAMLDYDATRFEPHVFRRLKDVRDGKRKLYNGISRDDIADATDDALRALSHSYGLTQIMGWSMVKMLDGTIADLRDPDKHLTYAVKRLEIVAGAYLKRKEWEKVLRIWNTGIPNGKTYHDSYVPGALAEMREWEAGR